MGRSRRKYLVGPSHPDKEAHQCRRMSLSTAAMNVIAETVESDLEYKENARKCGENCPFTSNRVACPDFTCNCTEIGTPQAKVTIRTQVVGSGSVRTGRNVDRSSCEH